MAFTVRLKLLGDMKRKRSKEVVSSHEAKQARGNRESSVSKVVGYTKDDRRIGVRFQTVTRDLLLSTRLIFKRNRPSFSRDKTAGEYNYLLSYSIK